MSEIARRNVERLRNLRLSIPYWMPQPAVTGKLDPVTGVVMDDPASGLPPGYIWVRIGGSRSETRAVNMISKAVADVPCRVGISPEGLLTAFDIRATTDAIRTWGDDLPSLGVPPPTQKTNNAPLPSALLMGGRVLPKTGLTVTVEAYPPGKLYANVDVDLTADIPGTANNHLWDVAYIDTDGTVGWVQTTAVAGVNNAVLDVSDAVEAAIPTGAIRLFAYKLSNGQTSFTSADYVDLREHHLFHEPRNNYEGTTAPTVTDDESLGYGFASRWYDTVAQALYVCWDATTGAADWHLIGGSGSLSDATVSAIGALLLDESPLSGHPIALTLVRLGMWLGVAMLGGDRHVHSFNLPTNPDVSASETDRWARVGGGANPVLSGGVSWEGDAVYEPTVLVEDDTLYMFYTGGFGVVGAGAAAAIGLATAPITDPTNWTKYASNPVLGKGGSGVSGIACRNFVLKHGDLYYMYYADGAGAGANLKVATSTDKINWTVVGTALAYNAQGWMNGVANTSVWVEQGNQWKMMYEAWTGTIWKIGTATSTDGLTFTPNAANPLTDLQVGTGMYGGAYVLPQKFEGNYVLYYHAATSGTLPTRLYRALSDGDDLTSWTQYADNPILTYGVDAFEVDQVADAHVIELLGKSYLFYDGDDNVAETAAIGLLTFDGTLAELVGGRGRTAWLQADDTIDPAILPLATSSAFGAVKPDNDTITVAAGVISAVSAAYAPLSTGDTDAPLVFDSEGRILIGRVA